MEGFNQESVCENKEQNMLYWITMLNHGNFNLNKGFDNIISIAKQSVNYQSKSLKIRYFQINLNVAFKTWFKFFHQNLLNSLRFYVNQLLVFYCKFKLQKGDEKFQQK